MPEIAVVSPEAAVARARRPEISVRLPGADLASFSLERFLAAPHAPRRIVVCPGGRTLSDDLAFLRAVRKRVLWPAPEPELAGAIAGLRGSHDPAPNRAGRAPAARGRRSALLLERDVTISRARRAASSGAPREWIVESVQSVRIGADGLDELRRLGIRWSVLEPVEVIAVAASPALLRARSRWSRWLPDGIAVWKLGRGARSRSK